LRLLTKKLEFRQRELLNEIYFFIEAAFQTYVTEKNQARAHTSSLSENINNSHIHALAQNQAILFENDFHRYHHQVQLATPQ
jgi:hypothetical protein